MSFVHAALGGALGACARHLFSVALAPVAAVFPWATLGVNLLGCFAIGLASGAWSDSQWFQDWGRPLIAVGLLGGFTTFSAFSLETLTLVSAGRVLMTALYITATLVGCLVLAWAGWRLGSG